MIVSMFRTLTEMFGFMIPEETICRNSRPIQMVIRMVAFMALVLIRRVICLLPVVFALKKFSPCGISCVYTPTPTSTPLVTYTATPTLTLTSAPIATATPTAVLESCLLQNSSVVIDGSGAGYFRECLRDG